MVPSKLKKGDTICVIAPSNYVSEDDKKYLKQTEKMFNEKGINIVYGKNIYSNELGYGATPEQKAEDLNWAFKNKNIQAIFCAKGGENSNSLFEYIDYKLIKKNPKIFCGFSDSTFLINMIYQKTKLITFHATTFKAISNWDDIIVFQDIINKLFYGRKELKIKEDEFKTINNGQAEGILVGGNLNCIREMVCGKYRLDFQDKILFIEDLAEESNPKFISNFLYYMKQNDVFSKIKALWIGNYEHESTITLEKIVKDVLKEDYNFPIIKSNSFGHINKKQTIPIGVRAKINTEEENKIILLEEYIR